MILIGKKFVRLIKYLNGTNKNYLTLSSDELKVLKWYVEARFVVHPDSKSHTGKIITMVQVAMQLFSRKHKLNTRLSTEAELVFVNGSSVYII